MTWRTMDSAPTNGEAILLYVYPPIDTNDLCGWVPQRSLSVVVGWANGHDYRDGSVEWNCGLCEEGTADTEGYSSALQIAVKPTHWAPLPKPPGGIPEVKG